MVESAVLVSLVGVLAAIALPTFVRAVETSKLSEATAQLQALYVGVASYYAQPRPITNARSGFCLPEAAGPTPEKPSAQPVAADFSTSATWQALRFAPAQALRYRYSYTPTQAGCQLQAPAIATSFSLRAEGDLDSDGIYSVFERTARISAPGELLPDPVLHVRDRVE